MYHDIQVILSRLIAKAEQLIDNVTTNLAESWIHVHTSTMEEVNNRLQYGSWEHCCMGAGLQHNMGKEWDLWNGSRLHTYLQQRFSNDSSQQSAIRQAVKRKEKEKTVLSSNDE